MSDDVRHIFNVPSSSGVTYVLEAHKAYSQFFSAGEAYFWSIKETGVAVSPLFSSPTGASTWLKFMSDNDMMEHRVFQFGLDCLCFVDGEYIWWNDERQTVDVDDIYYDYDSAVNSKLFPWMKNMP